MTVEEVLSHPEQHRHLDFQELMACCSKHGVLDTSLLDAHEQVSERTNGGVKCDVLVGPCSCGAWH